MPRSILAVACSLAAAIGVGEPAAAQGLAVTHPITAAVANQLVADALTACKEQGYNVTAVVLDTDAVRQAMLRGDGAGIATPGVAYDKAFTSVTTRTDTGALVERFKTTPPSQYFLKEPHLLLQGALGPVVNYFKVCT